MPQPRLIAEHVPPAPRAAVVVLHGGASRGEQVMVSPTQLSVIRMIPIAHRLQRAGGEDLAVYRLLNSVRGWDTRHTPVDDARWALAQLEQRLPDVPVGLVGHSLGGRAALLSAAAPQVKCVVALAPWVYPTDRLPPAEARMLIVHGSRDRIAKPANAEAVARSARPGQRVGFVTVDGGKHAMLRHHATFDGYAAQFSAACLLGGAHGEQVSAAIRDVLAGQRWVRA